MTSNSLHHYYHLLATVAALGTLLSSIVITTTAYAQPRNNRGPCPEDFELNRGGCRTEPTLTCENYNVYQPRTHIDENGDCVVEENNVPACVTEEGEPEEAYSYFYKSCYILSTGTGGEFTQLTDTEPTCDHIEGSTLQYTARGEATCVFYTNVGPADQKCDTGTLNEESGMCEVKPGRGNR